MIKSIFHGEEVGVGQYNSFQIVENGMINLEYASFEESSKHFTFLFEIYKILEKL